MLLVFSIPHDYLHWAWWRWQRPLPDSQERRLKLPSITEEEQVHYACALARCISQAHPAGTVRLLYSLPYRCCNENQRSAPSIPPTGEASVIWAVLVFRALYAHSNRDVADPHAVDVLELRIAGKLAASPPRTLLSTNKIISESGIFSDSVYRRLSGRGGVVSVKLSSPSPSGQALL